MYKQMSSVLKQCSVTFAQYVCTPYHTCCQLLLSQQPCMCAVHCTQTPAYLYTLYTPIIVTQDKLNCMVYTLLRVGNVMVRICCGLQYIMAYMGSHKCHTALKIGAQSYAHTHTTYIELMLTCRTCGGTPSASLPLPAHSPLCTLGTQRLQRFQ